MVAEAGQLLLHADNGRAEFALHLDLVLSFVGVDGALRIQHEGRCLKVCTHYLRNLCFVIYNL